MKSKLKKILAVLLSVTAMSLTFAACGGNKDDGTCDHFYKIADGKCMYCGEEHPHEWNKGVCTGCYYSCQHTKHNAITLLCNVCGVERFHDYRSENGGKCTMCDETSSYEHYAVPQEYRAKCAQGGTVVRVEYETETYAYNEYVADKNITPEYESTMKKDMYVYLPYGYTEEKQYDVLYLIHGSTGSQSMWFGRNEYRGGNMYNIEILDNLIAKGEMKETIVVTPTYYFMYEGETENNMRQRNEAAETRGMGYNSKYFTGSFYKELKNVIIPVIETQYSTYAGCLGKEVSEVTAEDFIGSRHHRAMAGLSLGSTTTWESGLRNSTDYIASFGCFSGAPETPPGNNSKTPQTTASEIIADLNEKFAGYNIDFLYTATGSDEVGMGNLTKIVDGVSAALIADNTWFTAENTVYINKLDKHHDFENWYIDLYNVMKYCFFKS